MTDVKKTVNEGRYLCQYDWPVDCTVQGDDFSVVLTDDTYGDEDTYETAFFEAFPRNPDTFIRGEGETLQEAETNAWNQWQQVLTCPGHEFERPGYKNGAGVCQHCGMFGANVFDPLTTCIICSTPTTYTSSKKKDSYCQAHAYLIPDEDLYDYQKTNKRRQQRHHLTTLADIQLAHKLAIECEDFIEWLSVPFTSEGLENIREVGEYAILMTGLESAKFNRQHVLERVVFYERDDKDVPAFIYQERDEQQHLTGRWIKVFTPNQRIATRLLTKVEALTKHSQPQSENH